MRIPPVTSSLRFLAEAFVFTVAIVGVAIAEDSSESVDHSPRQQISDGNGAIAVALDKIWAFRMPGTIDIAKTIPKSNRGVVKDIRNSLSHLTANEGQEFSAFAVAGDGLTALNEAKMTVVGGSVAKHSFRPNDQLWIVFYTRTCPYYVHIDAVERTTNSIRIEYRFVPHEETIVTVHFALIPIGRLSNGKYQIQMTEVPMDPKLRQLGYRPPTRDAAKSFVCQSSTFDVKESGDE